MYMETKRKASFEKIMVDSYFMYTQESNSLDPDGVQIVCIDDQAQQNILEEPLKSISYFLIIPCMCLIMDLFSDLFSSLYIMCKILRFVMCQTQYSAILL